ncbi:MAG: hypothetical protein NTY38_20580 [Acidobacteria bacterium]|nr:hypothetical protein [Acidobacteriota bacterium]
MIEAGLTFLQSLARDTGGLSSLVTVDARTNRPVLAIPLPEALDGERLGKVISGLLQALGR